MLSRCLEHLSLRVIYKPRQIKRTDFFGDAIFNLGIGLKIREIDPDPEKNLFWLSSILK